ncbi:MAG: efflux RND transporter periplasmic adaptor subunit [Defluviitaleaceae bacterium]|nr:efflux RND transporter periplasmic adaptor subunit [Defluviitaleaceae bacterium]
MQKVKTKKKMLFIIATVVIIGVVFILATRGRSEGEGELPSISVMPLTQRPLVDSISASGGVRSMETTNVFSSQTGIIQQLAANVGDSVSVGDALAVLDDTTLRNQIRQAENNLLSSYGSLDSSHLNARAAFENARSALERQTLAYNTQRSDLENGTSSQILTMENAASNAFVAWENAVNELSRRESDHESNLRLFEAGAISRSDLDTSAEALRVVQNTVNTTSAAYDTATIDLNAARASQTSQVEATRLDLEAARINYNNAARTLDQFRSGTTSALTTHENQIISLEMLHQQLEDSVITSPVNGVITDRTAVVGGSATGILFVIEDTKDLYVTMRVREHNLSRIFIGQRAIVTVDAAGSRIFNGEVIYISPRAVTQPGDTSVEFEVRVRIFDVDDSLVRIGMNASANIIVDSRDDAFAVFYDAIVNVPDEGSFIYVLSNGIVGRVPVTTGMRTDMFMEVMGESLTEGMVVISNPSLVEVGQVIDEDRLISPRTFIPPSSGDMHQGAQGAGGQMMIQGGGQGGGTAVRISN